jgi:hypothetical protein
MFAEVLYNCKRIALWRILLNQMPKGQGGFTVNLSGKGIKVVFLIFCTFAELFFQFGFIFS